MSVPGALFANFENLMNVLTGLIGRSTGLSGGNLLISMISSGVVKFGFCWWNC